MNGKMGQKNHEVGLLVENDSFLRGHYKINVLNGQGRTWDEQRGFGRAWTAGITNLSHVVIQSPLGYVGLREVINKEHGLISPELESST